MSALLRVARILGQLPVFVASAALFFLMVMTFFDVLLRSTINLPSRQQLN